jgi:hypothetical protein
MKFFAALLLLAPRGGPHSLARLCAELVISWINLEGISIGYWWVNHCTMFLTVSP